MDVGFNHRHAKAVFSPVPLRQFGGCGRFSLPVQSHQEKGGASRLELSRWAENANQFGVEDVHRLCLYGQSRPSFVLFETRFHPVHNFLRLSDVKIRFLQSSAKASGHLTKFFFVEFALAFEQAQGTKNAAGEAFERHDEACGRHHFNSWLVQSLVLRGMVSVRTSLSSEALT